MSEPLGRGPWGSLGRRVDEEIRKLTRENRALRHARYSAGRRLLQRAVGGRSVAQFLIAYSIVLALTFVGEWASNHYIPCWLPRYSDSFEAGFLKDLGSYLLAAQIGILAIVSVAVAVVTLLSDRNYGASVNTDIRLYYVESYSYELAISSVALLLVLIVQLFWPFHNIINAIGFGAPDDWFKFFLSSLHTLWFCVNIFLFLQFIVTTLRFVEPSTREALRERYSANEVIPRDARARLLRALYLNAPSHLFGKEILKEGPAITFGYGPSVEDPDSAEVTATFANPKKLVDVHLRPLHWALSRWQKRVRQKPRDGRPANRVLLGNQIAVVPNFDAELEGKCDLVVRRGDVALSGLEKWVIRRSLRFAPVALRSYDMPTPDDFLEQLIDKLIAQIDEGASTGFRAVLAEVIHYHRFILAAQNTKDDAGNAFNFAEVGNFMSRPDSDWVRQYRRAFVAAADKIGTDTTFIDRLSNLASRLVPDDSLDFSQRVLQTLLQLGIHEVVSLEDWVTRRLVASTVAGTAAPPTLAGSDKRAYESALIGFVGGWEALAGVLIASLSLRRRDRRTPSDAQWIAFRKGYPILQTHLQYAAYFLVAAVWNDDALGADRFRDLLLRWTQPFYPNLQSAYEFGHTLLITPDLTGQEWPAVNAEVTSRMKYGQEMALPGAISGLLLWEVHCDVVCVSALVALYWYASGQQPSITAAETAVLTLRRQKREGDGADLTQTQPKTVFRLLFDFVVRYALSPRFGQGYSAAIEGLIQLLMEPASRPMVSGRVYGGYGILGFETIRIVFLAAMAANLPDQGGVGITKLIEDLKTDPLFAEDKTVTGFIWTIQQLVNSLDQMEGNEIYARAARAFNGELELAATTARLKEELGKLVKEFETLRARRLRDAPLDDERMALVRRRMSEAIMANGPNIACFRSYDIWRDPSGAIPTHEVQFGVLDKGIFTSPPMSTISIDEMPSLFVEQVRSGLSNALWWELYRRPKRVVPVDVTGNTDAFWRLAIAEAKSVGTEPILLVPYVKIGEEMTMLLLGGKGPAGLDIIQEAGNPSGGGVSYRGTVEGIPVYSARVLRTQAIICSRYLVRSITYGVVHGEEDIIDFTFVDGEDLERSRITLKYAQRIDWSDDAFVEFAMGEDAGTQ